MTKRPLFPGDCEIDEIYKIFRLLGTPTEEIWPNCTALQDWNPAFPQWPRLALRSVAPTLCQDGLDFVEACLHYDPKVRGTDELRTHTDHSAKRVRLQPLCP